MLARDDPYMDYMQYKINPGKSMGKRNNVAADPKDSQMNPAQDAGPTVYSCGIRGIRAASGWDLYSRFLDPAFHAMSCFLGTVLACFLV